MNNSSQSQDFSKIQSNAQRKNISASILIVALFVIITYPQWLYGWSSVKPDFWGARLTAFATHEFLNEMAYKELKKHPAIKQGIALFPSLDEIQDHSMVDQGQNGNGPDNPRLTDYSWHWFNPEKGIPESKAPVVVAKYYGALRNTFLSRHLDSISAAPRETGAHSAAYASHFIQDMTCPFHVVGIAIPSGKPTGEKPSWDSRGNLSRSSPLDRFALAMRGYAANEEMKTRIAGPYRQYTAAEWNHLLTLAFSAYNEDHRKDWFDPNYYDGNSSLPVETSGHFLYETAVEIAYKRSSSHAAEWKRLAAEQGYISPLWRNGMKPEDFTRAVAKETRRRMVHGSDLVFDTRMNFSSQTLTVKVPYDDWWRAIQATYTLWRASFCALYIGHKDVRLVKLPEKPGLYDVQVSVRNLEPNENASQVVIIGEIPNHKFKGNAKIASVVANEQQLSPWVSLGKIHLDNPKDLPGKIRLTVKGAYQKIPDAQEAIYQYPLNAVETQGEITLTDMRGWTQQKAKSYLEQMGLVMKETSAGNPPSDLDQYTVKSHTPAGGAIVAKGERINVHVYGRFMVAVPNVSKPPLSQTKAAEIIKKAKLKPSIEDREADRSIPEGQVVGQNPAPGTVVIPDTEVQLWVAKHSQKPAAAPTAAISVKSVTITPHKSTIRLDQTINMTVTAYGTNGAPLNEASLRQISFRWGVSPATAASISINGNTAILTPREPGPLRVACAVEWVAPGRERSKRTSFPREALVTVLPPKDRARGPDKQTPPPPTKTEDPCTKLERLFHAAMASNDFKTAASILVDAKECPFAKTRLRALEQNKDKQCRELFDQIQAAIRNKDRYLATTLFEKGRKIGCNFPDNMIADNVPGDKRVNKDTGVSGELEGRWRIVRVGGKMIVRFRKTSETTYVGILEANPDNNPCWVKPGEQWMRATRTGANTYRVESVEYRMKMISPGNWVKDESYERWWWGGKTFRVNGDTAGYTELPQGFVRLK